MVSVCEPKKTEAGKPDVGVMIEMVELLAVRVTMVVLVLLAETGVAMRLVVVLGAAPGAGGVVVVLA